MSMSIIQRHFPGSGWKKYYSQIVFYTISVFHHIKPAFLWDFGPALSAKQIFDFVKDYRLFFKLHEPVLVISVDDHIIVACVNDCLKNLKADWLFIEIKQQTFNLLKSKGRSHLNEMIKFIETQLKNCIDCNLLELSTKDIVCLPCLFGLLLNYPLIYYFESDYYALSVQLKIFVVSCDFSYEYVTGRFKVYSFSVPQSLLDSHIDRFVSFWFNSLQFSGENIFSNLSLECQIRDVDALIL